MKEMATIQSSVLASPTEDEILVAQILVDLPSMIRKFESSFTFQWGSKNRRSRFKNSSSFQKTLVVEVEEREAETEAEPAPKASPLTPLAFPPSESDENPTHSFKTSSKKRSREKYIDTIEELTQRRDLLRQEIAIVNNYYQNLIEYNSHLKALKQQVQNRRERKVGRRQENNEMSGEEAEPLGVDEMAEHSIGPISAQFHSGPKSLGPLGIPDLNISAEEEHDLSQPLDFCTDRRARYAEARRRRMDIIKIKSVRTSTSSLKLLRTK